MTAIDKSFGPANPDFEITRTFLHNLFHNNSLPHIIGMNMIPMNNLDLDESLKLLAHDLLFDQQQKGPMPTMNFPAMTAPPFISSRPPLVTVRDDKPMEKPKRALSAYNIFFQKERQRILDETPEPTNGKKPRRSHGKIGFAPLARMIAAKWKSIDEHTKAEYKHLATQEKARYNQEMQIWKSKQHQRAALAAANENAPVMPTMQQTAQDLKAMLQAPQLLNQTLFAPPATITPVPGSPPPMQQQVAQPDLSELFTKLDSDCLDLLVNTFRD